MSEIPSEDVQPTEERWVYAGAQKLQGGKIGETWIDDEGDGKELYYARTKGLRVMGGIYTVKVIRTDKGATRIGTPEWTGDRLPIDSDRVRAWAVRDTSVQLRTQQERREANAAKVDALDEAMAPLLAIAKTCRTRYEREALIATVLRRMTGGWGA